MLNGPGRFRLIRHGMRIIQPSPLLNPLSKHMSCRVSDFDTAQDFLPIGLILAVPFNNRRPEISTVKGDLKSVCGHAF